MAKDEATQFLDGLSFLLGEKDNLPLDCDHSGLCLQEVKQGKLPQPSKPTRSKSAPTSPPAQNDSAELQVAETIEEDPNIFSDVSKSEPPPEVLWIASEPSKVEAPQIVDMPYNLALELELARKRAYVQAAQIQAMRQQPAGLANVGGFSVNPGLPGVPPSWSSGARPLTPPPPSTGLATATGLIVQTREKILSRERRILNKLEADGRQAYDDLIKHGKWPPTDLAVTMNVLEKLEKEARTQSADKSVRERMRYDVRKWLKQVLAEIESEDKAKENAKRMAERAKEQARRVNEEAAKPIVRPPTRPSIRSQTHTTYRQRSSYHPDYYPSRTQAGPVDSYDPSQARYPSNLGRSDKARDEPYREWYEEGPRLTPAPMKSSPSASTSGHGGYARVSGHEEAPIPIFPASQYSRSGHLSRMPSARAEHYEPTQNSDGSVTYVTTHGPLRDSNGAVLYMTTHERYQGKGHLDGSGRSVLPLRVKRYPNVAVEGQTRGSNLRKEQDWYNSQRQRLSNERERLASQQPDSWSGQRMKRLLDVSEDTRFTDLDYGHVKSPPPAKRRREDSSTGKDRARLSSYSSPEHQCGGHHGDAMTANPRYPSEQPLREVASSHGRHARPSGIGKPPFDIVKKENSQDVFIKQEEPSSDEVIILNSRPQRYFDYKDRSRIRSHSPDHHSIRVKLPGYSRDSVKTSIRRLSTPDIIPSDV
ncbi:hypothetical protein MMC25_005792 [Agyrium rufum]|nr:hypothetical protein [Agyrium rufum]